MGKLAEVRNFDATTMELGGKVRTLQFDMNAYAELEDKYGSIEKAMNQLQKGGMKDIRTILWVGLIHEEAIIDETSGEPTGYNITPYQVGNMIKNAGMLKEVSEKLSRAMSDGMTPEDLEEAEKLVEAEAKNA